MGLGKLSINIEREAPMTIEKAAKLDGVPPFVLLGTMISTMSWKNTVTFRSSGPIPEGLYRKFLEGKAAPKDFNMKAKSSNWGPQEGFAVENDRLARSQFQKDQAGNIKTDAGGKPLFEIRKHDDHDLPRDASGKVQLPTHDLKLVLEDIINDATKSDPKYTFPTDNNPDKNGILRFQQIHENPAVASVIFSIHLNDANAQPAPSSGLHLVSSPTGASTRRRSLLQQMAGVAEKANFSFPISMQLPGEPAATPIKVYGKKSDDMVTVRDADIDQATTPPLDAIRQKFGVIDSAFMEPLDMSDKNSGKALAAAEEMLETLFEMNMLEWEQYNDLKTTKQAEAQAAGMPFDETKIADRMPMVPQLFDLDLLKDFVITVGLGTPLELYQMMEINIINTKLLTLFQTDPEIRMEDFSHDAKRNGALMKLSQTVLPAGDMREHYMIQHPTECRNLNYTSERGATVMVHGKGLGLAHNDQELIKYLRSNATHEQVPINPEWLGKKPGANTHAEDWAVFYISHYDEKHIPDPRLKAAVNDYVLREPEKMARRLEEIADTPQVKSFMESNPGLRKALSTVVEKLEETNEQSAAVARFRP